MDIHSFGYKVLYTINKGYIRYCKACKKPIQIGAEYYLIWTPQTTVIFDTLFFLCIEHGKEFASKHSIEIEEY